MRHIHQHFQNDVELALRAVKVKDSFIRALKKWALDNMQLYELLKTLNSSTYLDASPATKVRHLLLDEILKDSIEGSNYWERVAQHLMRYMYTDYWVRQKDFVKLFNLKIGDNVFVTKLEHHLYFPYILNVAYISACDRSVIFTVLDISNDFIVIHNETDATSLKVPYSLIYKTNGSIIYPKRPKIRRALKS